MLTPCASDFASGNPNIYDSLEPWSPGPYGVSLTKDASFFFGGGGGVGGLGGSAHLCFIMRKDPGWDLSCDVMASEVPSK